MTTPTSASTVTAPIPAPARLPLRGWALELARRWNGGTYSLFVLDGNIFDLFPVQENSGVSYVPLKTFLRRRLFPERACVLFYDISGGLTFAAPEMQQRFFAWLEVFDTVENTNFHEQGPPKNFLALAPILTRFFLKVAEDTRNWKGVTLVVEFPEMLIPASEQSGSSVEERINLVTFLKWASAPELAHIDVGVLLITESAAQLQADLLRNPNVAQVHIDLPDADERLRFLQSGWAETLAGGKPFSDWSDFTAEDLATRTSGLNLLRIQHFLAESIRNGARVTSESLTASKKKLIEEYCQGLVRFKDPRPGVDLTGVATHVAAKKKLSELAWLIKNGKTDVLERGVLVPGRVGVGKSYLIDCFASECGLPVMEMGDFRSKWVGDTERQQSRVLMTIRALGPVIVVVDEADAVFGSREGDGDSGVSGRVFAAFAAHIGDSSLRGRELWVAMTSRPDLLAIDMKRQGRFGLCVPLFPAQGAADVTDLFTTVARMKKITLSPDIAAYIRDRLGSRPLTGSDVEAILIRAKESAVLAKRDTDVQRADLEEAVTSFIDPLDPELLAMQELAAVLACSDRRYLPEHYLESDRATLVEEFARLKDRVGRLRG
jgi:AAA+ superfamily predicted ATPase